MSTAAEASARWGTDLPGESLDALHEALGGLFRAAGHLASGHPGSARLELEDIDTLRAADEAFPPGSPESCALSVLIAAVERRAAAGRAA